MRLAIKFTRLFIIGLLLLSYSTSHAEAPKLVVFLSIDQMRGDYPARVHDRLAEGGLRYLMEKGLWYDNAHFGHACTYTATGHATLVTGGNATEHGMVGNRWYNPKTGKSVYSVSDAGHSLLGVDTPKNTGTSPKNLLGNTIGDKLIDATNGRAKVFSLSQKDRAAILMAGHGGKAFWYHATTGQYITSDYYYRDYPEWVAQWNAKRMADGFAGQTWNLLLEPDTYEYLSEDKRSVELGNPTLGKTFPHTLPATADAKLFGTLIYTPYSDVLALNFARQIIESEELGKRDVTDMLMISLSTTDIIGHSYGPYSLEQEDNLLRLDQSLASFFNYLDERFGLNNIVIALSSDHGVDGRPKLEDGSGYKGDIVTPKAITDAADAAMTTKYGTTFTRRYYVPYLYLDEQAINKAGFELAEVERVAAEAVARVEGIGISLARTDILSGNYDKDDEILQRVAKAVHPERSGHVAVFQSPYYEIISRRGLFTATHGSPWDYDTHVPVMLAGKDIPAQRVDRRVGPEHIAPTLAQLLGIEAPENAVHQALKEVQ